MATLLGRQTRSDNPRAAAFGATPVTKVPVPKSAPFLATLERVPRTGNPRWRNTAGDRVYEWDGLHGELEVYNRRGRHLGAVDPRTGVLIKLSVKGRKIDV